ncbi:MAG: VTT domain-containing protein, partial [Gemmatimonadota bacterium]
MRFALALLADGPLWLFLPAAVEPMVMIFARLYPAVVVAGVATVSAVLAEYVDYRVFAGILLSEPMGRARNTRTARFIVWLFRQSPFLAVFLGALTPLPFWLVRICAVLGGYSIRRFLVATAVGRFPRFVCYALLGTWLPIRNDVLAAGALALTVVFAIVIWVRARRRPSSRAPTSSWRR